jgi:hypothetical protein
MLLLTLLTTVTVASSASGQNDSVVIEKPAPSNVQPGRGSSTGSEAASSRAGSTDSQDRTVNGSTLMEGIPPLLLQGINGAGSGSQAPYSGSLNLEQQAGSPSQDVIGASGNGTGGRDDGFGGSSVVFTGSLAAITGQVGSSSSTGEEQPGQSLLQLQTGHRPVNASTTAFTETDNSPGQASSPAGVRNEGQGINETDPYANYAN